MNKVVMSLAVMVVVAATGLALGDEGAMEPGFGLNPRIASALNLTDGQKAQIQARQQAFLEAMSPLCDQLFSRRLELKNLWAKAPPDQAAIIQKQLEIQAIRTQMQAKATEHQLECRRLLTPDQQEKLGALMIDHPGWDEPNPGAGHAWPMHGK